MADRVNKMWGLKTTDRQLKKIGRDNVAEYLIAEATKVINEADLSKGQVYLEPDWGVRELCAWLERKFEVEIAPDQIDLERPREELRDKLVEEIRKLYHEKEIEFPVTVALARYHAGGAGTGRPAAGRGSIARGCITGTWCASADDKPASARRCSAPSRRRSCGKC